jgi:hypothetical protein
VLVATSQKVERILLCNYFDRSKSLEDIPSLPRAPCAPFLETGCLVRDGGTERGVQCSRIARAIECPGDLRLSDSIIGSSTGIENHGDQRESSDGVAALCEVQGRHDEMAFRRDVVSK